MANKCKKLGNRATKREQYEAHRIRMEVKRIMNDHNHRELTTGPQPWIFANISKHHEHYGDTPAEHAARKSKKDLDNEVEI